MINAFSLPGGPVYIGEGMLDLMMSEDELANVLAHEIEHIDHYHCVERVQLEAKLKDLNLDILGALLQIPLDFWEAGYQKDEEFEADREGMYLACSPATLPMAPLIRSNASPNCATNTSSTRKARTRSSRTGHSEFERLFPFAPAPLRASRASQPPHRAGALGNSKGAEAVPRRV